MKIVLFEPEIPPNTGNIARLCASAGIHLNLIEPLGFKLNEKALKRAGMDYWKDLDVTTYINYEAENGGPPPRCVLTSARGGEPLQHFAFAPDDCLVFGPETRGLPPEILKRSPYRVRIPMRKDSVRSINLSTAAGIVLFTAMSSCGLMEGPEWRAPAPRGGGRSFPQPCRQGTALPFFHGPGRIAGSGVPCRESVGRDMAPAGGDEGALSVKIIC